MSPRIVLLLLIQLIISNQPSQGKVLKESIYELGPKLYNFYSAADPKVVPENFIASPLGLTLGLGLIQLGGSQNLKQLILEEIFDWKDAEIDFHSNITEIQKLIKSSYSHNDDQNQKSLSKDVVPSQEQPVKDLEDVEVNVQSAIFHKEDLQLNPTFQRHAIDYYNSQFIALNQSFNDEETQMIVNQWARNASRDLIQEFPAPRNLQVLLANTVYFEGDWVEPFAKAYTRIGDFKPTEDANHYIRIPFLLGKQDVPYYESDLFKMVRLSYVVKNNNSQDVAMFVVLPKTKEISLTTVVGNLTFESFRTIVKEKMLEWTVNIKIPKLTANRKLNLKQVLDSYFLKDRNNRRWTRDVQTKQRQMPLDDYHLSAASSQHDFILTDFVQETVLEVNEKGTRAASISGGYINYDSLSKSFRCDRPYLMIIYDAKHDIVLFWSAIHKPVAPKL